MDNGLVLILLFTFFLGMLSGWVMHIYSSRIHSIKGEHEYSSNCEVHGCDGQHV